MLLSVIIPTHNPHPGRLTRTLTGLGAQSLPASDWELVLVDNASSPPVDASIFPSSLASSHRIVREPVPGLTSARRHGLRETNSPVIVFVDDDNVLAPDYLERALAHLTTNPTLGALGGKSVGEFETAPPPWLPEFIDLLAIRDLGDAPKIALCPPGRQAAYPLCAPIGAGMVFRREAAQAWLERDSTGITDRNGNSLDSSGDNDIVLAIAEAGWSAGYFPDLQLTHLIPASRLEVDYLGRLNFGIQRSWVRVLGAHGITPWLPAAPSTVFLRKARAWFRRQAWRGGPAFIRWQGDCGNFEGRASLASLPRHV